MTPQLARVIANHVLQIASAITEAIGVEQGFCAADGCWVFLDEACPACRARKHHDDPQIGVA